VSKLIKENVVSLGFPGSKWYIEDMCTNNIDLAIGYCLSESTTISLKASSSFNNLVIQEDIGKFETNPQLEESTKDKKVNVIMLDWPGMLTDKKILVMRRLIKSNITADKSLLIQGFCDTGKLHPKHQEYFHNISDRYCVGNNKHIAIHDFMKKFIPNIGYKMDCHGVIEYKVTTDASPSFFHVGVINK
jgi:hypothetical protein